MGLAKRIIPCLDVDKPAAWSKACSSWTSAMPVTRWKIAKQVITMPGADEITFLDITASHRGAAIPPMHTVEQYRQLRCLFRLPWVAACVPLEDIRNLLNAGADKVAINYGGGTSTRSLSVKRRSGLAVPVYCGGHRREKSQRVKERTPTAGKSSPTAAANLQVWMRWSGHAR